MTRVALLLAGIAPFAVAVPAAAQSMDHSMHGSKPASKPAPAPATEPPVEAPMDHGNMQGMDMAPEASTCPPEHAAMGHCTAGDKASEKLAADMGAMEPDTAAPSDADCPPNMPKWATAPRKPAPPIRRPRSRGWKICREWRRCREWKRCLGWAARAERTCRPAMLPLRRPRRLVCRPHLPESRNGTFAA